MQRAIHPTHDGRQASDTGQLQQQSLISGLAARARHGALGIALAFCLLSVTPARAQSATDPAAQAKALLQSLAKQTEPVVREAMQRSTQALDRAAKLPKEQLEASQSLHRGALEWAQVAKNWVRVLEQERAAKKLEESVAALRTQLSHARALLEETHARKERAESLLRASKQETVAPPPAATPSTPAAGASNSPGTTAVKTPAATPGNAAPKATPAPAAPKSPSPPKPEAAPKSNVPPVNPGAQP